MTKTHQRPEGISIPLQWAVCPGTWEEALRRVLALSTPG